jgi:hypothetical protein
MPLSLHQRQVFEWLSLLAFLALTSLCTAQTVVPPQSTYFSTAAEESYSTYQMTGDGDLWPSCWADDGNLYAANGDGKNFANTFYAMAVGKISGTLPDLTGAFVAGDVGNNYSGNPYTDKPTGMLCIGGAIYLAYQNLNETTFEDAPAASIVESLDHGATWSVNPAVPMFGVPDDSSDPAAYKFTTIFFLDYGQNSANAIDGYVYAYGLDNDWRDETSVYLARVPKASVLDRSAWQFYSGIGGSTPTWSSDITQKSAVLTDQRELYPVMFGTDCPADQKIIAQGGAVYDRPLNRYIMATWGCATHEFYEAPQPWGPWSHFLSNDFGPLRLTDNRGQYGISIPSKFISQDGQTLYLQSNVCCSGDSYTYSLRRLYLQTYASASPANSLASDNLALKPGTRAISKSTHFGSLCGLNCSDQLNNGPLSNSEDDYDEESKTVDWWGYTWPQPYNINQIVYTTGTMFSNGGWYAGDLRVQVKQNFQWIDVPGATVTPTYPYSSGAGSQTAYSFSFPDTWGDGVRITGTPGGTAFFTSISRLAVYYSSTSGDNIPGFSLSVSPVKLSMPPGSSATATLSLTPTNGFNQQVAFACSGLPSESTCSFSPATVTPAGSTASTVSVTILTTAPTSAHSSVPSKLGGSKAAAGPAMGAMIFACLFFLRRKALHRSFHKGAAMIALLAMFAMAISCKGGNIGSTPPATNPGTPAGSSTITITATAGSGTASITQTATLTLTVQ